MDFKPASFSADDVLQVLDEQMAAHQGGLNFEMLEEYTALAGGRLSVFRSRDGRFWVVCIESIYYDARADLPMLGVYLMGNCLRPLQYDEAALERVLFIVPPDVPFPEEHPSYADIPRAEFSILRHGQVTDFKPLPQQYADAGLTWSQSDEESDAMRPQEMLRFLAFQSSEAFFASEDALRDLVDARRAESGWDNESLAHVFCGYKYEHGVPILSHELALFLQTHNWTHPRWDFKDGNYLLDSVPQIEVMRPLAEAIASGDLTAWNAQDPSVFNSHWSRWTEQALQEEWNQQFSDQQIAAQEVALAALDERLQVLAPDDLSQFVQDAQAVIADEDSQPPEVEEMPPDTMPEISIFSASFWNWNGYMIPIAVLREWLRRRPNRSNSNP